MLRSHALEIKDAQTDLGSAHACRLQILELLCAPA